MVKAHCWIAFEIARQLRTWNNQHALFFSVFVFFVSITCFTFGDGVAGRGGGEQCVILNLCFELPEALRLGIEGHVCELQLTTRAFGAQAQVMLDPPILLFRVHTVYCIDVHYCVHACRHL